MLGIGLVHRHARCKNAERCEPAHSGAVRWKLLLRLSSNRGLAMKQRYERAGQRTRERVTAGRSSNANGVRRTGLAVEGPGFLVWDEVASAARKHAGELLAVAPWRLRSAASRS
jgi:hypothetical protein